MKSTNQAAPSDIFVKWLANVARIQENNEYLNKYCVQLYNQLSSDGYICCILKGQSIAEAYGQFASFRQSGDIDAFVIGDFQNVVRYIQKYGQDKLEYTYKHIHWDYAKSVTVDLHYRLVFSRNLIRNARLQKWTKNMTEESFVYNDQLGYSVLNQVDNTFFLLYHLYGHFLYEGIGLRQFMDLYFVLMSISSDITKIDITKLIKEHKIEKFAGAVMWVLKKVFNIPDKNMLVQPNEKEGEYLLSEVFATGNMGKYDKRMLKPSNSNWVNSVINKTRHHARLVGHYPLELLWTPVSFLYIRYWRSRNII